MTSRKSCQLESLLCKANPFEDIERFLVSADAQHSQICSPKFEPCIRKLVLQILQSNQLFKLNTLFKVVGYLCEQDEAKGIHKLLPSGLPEVFDLIYSKLTDRLLKDDHDELEDIELLENYLHTICAFVPLVKDNCKWFNVNLTALLKLVLQCYMDFKISYEVLNNINGMLSSMPKESSYIIREYFQSSETAMYTLKELTSNLSIAGDFETQCEVMEIVIRCLPSEKRQSVAMSFNKNNKQLAELFVKISCQDFEKATRRYLLEVNKEAVQCRVFSFSYHTMNIGELLSENNEFSWVDFGFGSKKICFQRAENENDKTTPNTFSIKRQEVDHQSITVGEDEVTVVLEMEHPIIEYDDAFECDDGTNKITLVFRPNEHFNLEEFVEVYNRFFPVAKKRRHQHSHNSQSQSQSQNFFRISQPMEGFIRADTSSGRKTSSKKVPDVKKSVESTSSLTRKMSKTDAINVSISSDSSRKRPPSGGRGRICKVTSRVEVSENENVQQKKCPKPPSRPETGYLQVKSSKDVIPETQNMNDSFSSAVSSIKLSQNRRKKSDHKKNKSSQNHKNSTKNPKKAVIEREERLEKEHEAKKAVENELKVHRKNKENKKVHAENNNESKKSSSRKDEVVEEKTEEEEVPEKHDTSSDSKIKQKSSKKKDGEKRSNSENNTKAAKRLTRSRSKSSTAQLQEAANDDRSSITSERTSVLNDSTNSIKSKSDRGRKKQRGSELKENAHPNESFTSKGKSYDKICTGGDRTKKDTTQQPTFKTPLVKKMFFDKQKASPSVTKISKDKVASQVNNAFSELQKSFSPRPREIVKSKENIQQNTSKNHQTREDQAEVSENDIRKSPPPDPPSPEKEAKVPSPVQAPLLHDDETDEEQAKKSKKSSKVSFDPASHTHSPRAKRKKKTKTERLFDSSDGYSSSATSTSGDFGWISEYARQRANEELGVISEEKPKVLVYEGPKKNGRKGKHSNPSGKNTTTKSLTKVKSPKKSPPARRMRKRDKKKSEYLFGESEDCDEEQKTSSKYELVDSASDIELDRNKKLSMSPIKAHDEKDWPTPPSNGDKEKLVERSFIEIANESLEIAMHDKSTEVSGNQSKPIIEEENPQMLEDLVGVIEHSILNKETISKYPVSQCTHISDIPTPHDVDKELDRPFLEPTDTSTAKKTKQSKKKRDTEKSDYDFAKRVSDDAETISIKTKAKTNCLTPDRCTEKLSTKRKQSVSKSSTPKKKSRSTRQQKKNSKKRLSFNRSKHSSSTESKYGGSSDSSCVSENFTGSDVSRRLTESQSDQKLSSDHLRSALRNGAKKIKVRNQGKRKKIRTISERNKLFVIKKFTGHSTNFRKLSSQSIHKYDDMLKVLEKTQMKIGKKIQQLNDGAHDFLKIYQQQVEKIIKESANSLAGLKSGQGEFVEEQKMLKNDYWNQIEECSNIIEDEVKKSLGIR